MNCWCSPSPIYRYQSVNRLTGSALLPTASGRRRHHLDPGVVVWVAAKPCTSVISGT